ncbi:hypothetical protein LXA43DRAFT_1102189 [Ganoderma leucocontextum]|nr:hypothetical protein LXA43DRAFT_1102189 [Ganoderma leucocontextum]
MLKAGNALSRETFHGLQICGQQHASESASSTTTRADGATVHQSAGTASAPRLRVISPTILTDTKFKDDANTVHKIKAGTVWVNVANMMYRPLRYKQSDISRELGEYALAR